MDDGTVVARLDQVWRAHVVGEPRAQLEQWRRREPDTEHRLSIPTPTSQHLLVLVCSQYGLSLYRRARQRSSTLCVEAPDGFVSEVLWPLFKRMAQILEAAAQETTARIMEQWSRSRDGTSS